jgi:Zincin-like metallopeptidase
LTACSDGQSDRLTLLCHHLAKPTFGPMPELESICLKIFVLCLPRVKIERERAVAAAGDEPEAIPFLKRFTVFNADQCEDLPADLAPAPAPLAENLVLPQVEALIRATGAGLRIGGTRAFYVPSAGYIQVPPPSAYFEPVNWHRTVCHELGHNADYRIMPHRPVVIIGTPTEVRPGAA